MIFFKYKGKELISICNAILYSCIKSDASAERDTVLCVSAVTSLVSYNDLHVTTVYNYRRESFPRP